MRLLDIFITLPLDSQLTLSQFCDSKTLAKIFNGTFQALPSINQQTRRQVTMRGHSFVEVITHSSAQRLCYQIEGHGPIKHHLGVISLTKMNTHLRLRYQIFGLSNTLLPNWLLKLILLYDFKAAMRRLRKLNHAS
ncbi:MULTISPECIES: hypothetical protein [unclassified Pseudoalteromonas]|uniref:SRPBCC family protein n=1 Tax=Pseudoalteromonas amylolytica TaxID=1859457 RepID=A0A1S1MWP8_9GAMM|nr:MULTISPECIES: hypothetical protein [unclassified Pseudoalteromonas]MCF6435905.1 hypothetical protein [Pseudoalteromonas sp. MMG022]OHU89271.1 hypothetical protein BFC16_06455 [Pseudoalteromonas sp. JW3]OHU92171.1 hypothetical protein BET10_07560 [Pseudoalteromonas amylolytica]